jgi:hypothetical protein
MDALRLMRARGITSVEARAEEQRAYTEQFTARLAGTVWSVGGCKSWYQDASGVASVTWPAPTREYRRATRRFDPAPYALRTAGAAPPRTEPAHRLRRPRPGDLVMTSLAHNLVVREGDNIPPAAAEGPLPLLISLGRGR